MREFRLRTVACLPTLNGYLFCVLLLYRVNKPVALAERLFLPLILPLRFLPFLPVFFHPFRCGFLLLCSYSARASFLFLRTRLLCRFTKTFQFGLDLVNFLFNLLRRMNLEP